MNHSDFEIGTEFYTASGKWRSYKTAHLHARLPPAAHDRDDAGAIGLCWTVHVERERQTILVPVHHIRRHRGLTRWGLGITDYGRGR